MRTCAAGSSRSPKRTRKDIALFGGTFNPPHIGHLTAAREAASRLGLGHVIFIPSACPPHKDPGCLAGALDRFRMVKLAVAGNPLFSVSPIEIRRAGPSFTIDTVRAMRRLHPRGNIYFLIGADTVAELPTWRRYRDMLRRVRFAVVSRPGYRLKPLRGHANRFILIPIPGVRLSSTLLRARLAHGARTAPGLPRKVAGYIRRKRLYRHGAQECDQKCRS